MRIAFAVVGAVLLSVVSVRADFVQDFEANATGWNSTTRVTAGTDGIPTSGGGSAWHGKASAGAYTQWGGYNTVAVPFISSIAVYLDLNAYTNDTRFDLTTAVSKPPVPVNDGLHRRDFAFNVGFYDDASGPGAGTDRFVISASNATGRSNAYPKNPGRNPTDVTATGGTGWYTFEQDFRDNGFGILEVEMSVYNPASTLVGNWLLSSVAPPDVIGVDVGGNRYSWFPTMESAPNANNGWRAIDNTSLTSSVPEASAALFGGIACGVAGLAAIGRRKLAKWFA